MSWNSHNRSLARCFMCSGHDSIPARPLPSSSRLRSSCCLAATPLISESSGPNLSSRALSAAASSAGFACSSTAYWTRPMIVRRGMIKELGESFRRRMVTLLLPFVIVENESTTVRHCFSALPLTGAAIVITLTLPVSGMTRLVLACIAVVENGLSFTTLVVSTASSMSVGGSPVLRFLSKKVGAGRGAPWRMLWVLRFHDKLCLMLVEHTPLPSLVGHAGLLHLWRQQCPFAFLGGFHHVLQIIGAQDDGYSLTIRARVVDNKYDMVLFSSLTDAGGVHF